MESARPAKAEQLTVIIPTWNRWPLLQRCLASLMAQSAIPRILVVDDGSTDETTLELKRQFPSVDCLRLDRNGGFAKAVNLGLRQVKTEYIALLNNDAFADAGWAEAGLRAFGEYPGFSFFACRMLNASSRDLLDSAGDCYNRRGLPYKRGWGQPADRFPQAEEVLGASAGAAFYRRRVFEEVGLLDEDFYMYLEDVDFSLRCRKAGHRCLYLPAAVVYHLEAASDPEYPGESGDRPVRPFYSSRRVYWITRNRFMLMCLHQPLRHLPWLVLGWSKSLFFHLFKAGFTGSFLRGLAGGARQLPACIAKRLARRSQQIISTGELCRQLQKC